MRGKQGNPTRYYPVSKSTPKQLLQEKTGEQQ